jgi:hypothetical protein
MICDGDLTSADTRTSMKCKCRIHFMCRQPGLYRKLCKIEINSFAEWSPWLIVKGRRRSTFFVLAVLLERDDDSFTTTVGVELSLDIINLWAYSGVSIY